MTTEPEPTPLLPETRRALLHRVAVAQAEGRTPSLVAAVVRDGTAVWSGARSMIDGHAPDTDTQYRIGSITKTFVAVEVLRLRDEGLLDLADPLGKHLPDPAEVADVTIAQLLSHTAGLAAEATDPWWERTPGDLRPEPADLLGDQSRPHPAGRRFHYSNPGFALLGALVERLRDAPWDEVLEQEVLRPLGMARTTPLPVAPAAGGWAVHPWADVMQPEVVVDTGRMGPAGQLWSTAEDLGRWATFLLDGNDRVLSAATLAEMREPLTVARTQDLAGGWGLGIQLLRDHGRTLFGHGGSMPGFVAGLWISAEERLAGISLSNATSAPGVAAELVRIVAEREPRLPEPWRPRSTTDPELLALTGPWYWGTYSYLLRVLADRGLDLSPVRGQGRSSRFRAEADGTWTGLDGYFAGEPLRVVGQGAQAHLNLGTFVFTRQPYEPGEAVPGGVDPAGWQGAGSDSR
ncbi:MAG TPA: serine hydrolase domain-containing protein [Pseudonocardia sp.]|nr:serine hydrolase domain-containing protein [Pseudonocardia sp.]